MTANSDNIRKVPAAALQLVGGTVALAETDGDAATKTAAVKLLARSSKPIEHWYWGKVVHDFAGMTMHKQRLPLDYAHETGEVLGYVNHPNVTPDGLELTGVMTPFGDTDRASEVLFKMRQGVPYEASINFGGSGIRVQEIAENEVTKVNGEEFAGPGVVIRQWPLRGVAVCPYGADHNTSTQSGFAADGEFAVEYVSAIPNTEELEMPKQPDNKEQPVAVPPAAAPVAGPAPVQLAEPPPAPAPAAPQPDLRAEFVRMVKEFGAETAAKVFAEGGSYEDARAAHTKALEAKVHELEQAKELNGGTDPVKRGTDAASPADIDVLAAVNAKVASGMTRVAAWASVRTENPEAYAKYIAAANRRNNKE